MLRDPQKHDDPSGMRNAEGMRGRQMNRKKRAIFLTVIILTGIWACYSQTLAKERGRFIVIGTGPAGPAMATLQALNTIKEVDAIVASEEHLKLFEEYVGDKPVLFDPWQGLYDYKGKFWRRLNKEEMTEFFKEAHSAD